MEEINNLIKTPNNLSRQEKIVNDINQIESKSNIGSNKNDSLVSDDELSSNHRRKSALFSTPTSNKNSSSRNNGASSKATRKGNNKAEAKTTTLDPNLEKVKQLNPDIWKNIPKVVKDAFKDIIDCLIYTETKRASFEDTNAPHIAKLTKRVQKCEMKVDNVEDDVRVMVKGFETRLKNDIIDFKAEVQISLEEKDKVLDKIISKYQNNTEMIITRLSRMDDSDILKAYAEDQAEKATKQLMDELKRYDYGIDKKMNLISLRNDKLESLLKEAQQTNKELQLKLSNVEGKVAFISSDVDQQSKTSIQNFLNFQQNMSDLLSK